MPIVLSTPQVEFGEIFCRQPAIRRAVHDLSTRGDSPSSTRTGVRRRLRGCAAGSRPPMARRLRPRRSFEATPGGRPIPEHAEPHRPGRSRTEDARSRSVRALLGRMHHSHGWTPRRPRSGLRCRSRFPADHRPLPPASLLVPPGRVTAATLHPPDAGAAPARGPPCGGRLRSLSPASATRSPRRGLPASPGAGARRAGRRRRVPGRRCTTGRGRDESTATARRPARHRRGRGSPRNLTPRGPAPGPPGHRPRRPCGRDRRGGDRPGSSPDARPGPARRRPPAGR